MLREEHKAEGWMLMRSFKKIEIATLLYEKVELGRYKQHITNVTTGFDRRHAQLVGCSFVQLPRCDSRLLSSPKRISAACTQGLFEN